MKYLIIYAHPNPKSFCSAIKNQVEEQIKASGSEFVTRDLYQMGFNPVLGAQDFINFSKNSPSEDICVEQDLIRQSDVIIFVYPVWWFSVPAILKGYIDRVLSRGFAYDMKGHLIRGLLKGKRVMIFNTTGGPGFAYYLLGYLVAMKISIVFGIFKFCGMTVKLHRFFFAVPAISQKAREKMLDQVKRIQF
jgi:NAD(P)H dehydrogenase (quinone)